MNDYLTPEFIELAKKIQDEMEPRVGLFAMTAGSKILISYENFDDVCDYYEQNTAVYILLPDLGWLVRRLRESGYPHLCYSSYDKAWELTHYKQWDDNSHAALVYADTPELACLKALLKIKGIL